MKIVFVCTGNTCRSPLAQAIAQKYVEDNGLDIDVDSAGLSCSYGHEMAEHSQKIIESMGIFFTHTSQPVTQKMVEQTDYFVTMERWQKEALMSVAPNKTFCVADFCNEGDVDDPYGQSLQVYQDTADKIGRVMPTIIRQLLKKYDAQR
ncbi:MAG: hypothetical protein ACI4MY_01610 [Christensenellales bacterium]